MLHFKLRNSAPPILSALQLQSLAPHTAPRLLLVRAKILSRLGMRASTTRDMSQAKSLAAIPLEFVLKVNLCKGTQIMKGLELPKILLHRT